MLDNEAGVISNDLDNPHSLFFFLFSSSFLFFPFSSFVKEASTDNC